MEDGLLYLYITKHVYIKSTIVYVPSSELGLSQPLSRQRACSSPQNRGGGHTRRGARGWGSPNSDDLRKSLALCLLCVVHVQLLGLVTSNAPLPHPSTLFITKYGGWWKHRERQIEIRRGLIWPCYTVQADSDSNTSGGGATIFTVPAVQVRAWLYSNDPFQRCWLGTVLYSNSNTGQYKIIWSAKKDVQGRPQYMYCTCVWKR
jgi:hypothetical protein